MKRVNFEITPCRVPVVEIGTATKSTCRSLDSGDAHELKAKVVQPLDRQDKVDQNVTKKEWEAIDKLKQDDTSMVLPADKGHVIGVLKKEDYIVS